MRISRASTSTYGAWGNESTKEHFRSAAASEAVVAKIQSNFPREETTRKELVAVAPSAPASAAVSTTVTEAATTTSTCAALGLGPGFVHIECAPANLRAI
jgi:hypothetical protein